MHSKERETGASLYEGHAEDWSDMALLLAVLDTGSLAAAGEALGLSQPTVGRRLAALETRLDTTLFSRGGKRLIPTEMALSIEENARKMSREMFAIRRRVAGAVTGMAGQVTVSANEGTGSEWLIPVLADLQRMHPDIYVELKIDLRAADLVQREADIALRLGRPTQQELIARKLADVGFALYASEQFLAAHGPITSLDDLQDKPWVRGNFIKTGNDALMAFMSEHNLRYRIALSTNSPAAQIAAVRAGLGIAVISHRWASTYPELVPLLPALEVASLELWLVSHSDLRHSARMRAVADYIIEAARKDESLFAGGIER